MEREREREHDLTWLNTKILISFFSISYSKQVIQILEFYLACHICSFICFCKELLCIITFFLSTLSHCFSHSLSLFVSLLSLYLTHPLSYLFVIDTFLVSFLCLNSLRKKSEHWNHRTLNSLVVRKIFQSSQRVQELSGI